MRIGILMLFIGVALLSVTGCSTVNRDWEEAKQQNTIRSYQEFLTTHPDSQYRIEAEARISNLRRQKQEAEAVAIAREEARARKFTEGFSKLRKGMTLAEVSEVLGISFGNLMPSQGTVTFPDGHSFSFENGHLQEWK
jgi:hypothetical protein